MRTTTQHSLLSLGVLLFVQGCCHVLPIHEPSKRALLVGINKYWRGDGTNSFGNLHGTTDVAAFKQVLERPPYSFKTSDIVALLDERATRYGIIEAFQQHLIGKSKEGDILLFYFSGHGQPVKDMNGDEQDGMDESLVPYDYGFNELAARTTNLLDDDIEQLMNAASSKVGASGSLSMFIDACYSGSVTRAGHSGRGWEIARDGPRPPVNHGAPQDGLSGLFAANRPISGNTIVFSAARADQQANLTFANNRMQGAMTHFLLDRMAHARPGTTYRRLYEEVRHGVESQSGNQTPQIEGGGIDRVLFSGTVKPIPLRIRVKIVDKMRVTLDVGQLHGVTQESVFALYRQKQGDTTADEYVGTATVKKVGDVTSEAEVEKAAADKIQNKDIFWAVKRAHYFEDKPLRVYVTAGQLPPSIDIMKGFVTTQGVTEENSDVVFSHLGTMYRIARRDGSVVAEINANDHESAQQVKDVLLGVFRRLRLAGLHNTSPSPVDGVNVRLVPVEVDVNETNQVTQVRKSLSDAEGTYSFVEGTHVTIDVKNASQKPVYLTLFQVTPRNEVQAVFPTADAPVHELIVNDGQWHRLSTPTFVYRLETEGTYLLKGIVCTYPADFMPLLSLGLGANERATQLRSLPVETSSLGQLLDDFMRGDKVQREVSPTFWSTVELSFVVRGR